MNYITRAVATPIPQSQPFREEQVRNNAGGYSWEVDPWVQLQRFLLLGSQSGTYYVGEVDLTKANLTAVRECIAEDSGRAVNLVVDVLRAHRAAKPDTALYTLALCLKTADVRGRRTAVGYLPTLHLTGYQILKLASFVDSLGGWGRGTKRAFASWFLAQNERDLAYQAIKYQARDGWALSDLLRLSHPKADSVVRNAIFKWIVDSEYASASILPEMAGLEPIWGYRAIREPGITPELIIRAYRLPREAVPTEMLQSAEVWGALLDDMPMVATVRNLATLTRIGVLKPLGVRTRETVARLRDAEQIKRSGIHPMQIFSALMTYRQGSWEPDGQIVGALEAAFPLAFANVEGTGQRIVLGIDVSGSMNGAAVNGLKNVTAHQAAAAMALVIARTEPQAYFVAFDTLAKPMAIDSGVTLSHMLSQLPTGGGTDVAQPVLHALDRKIEADAFVILTDSESWAGNRHAMDALAEYRKRINPKAKLINVQMTATKNTNADPKDAGCLEAIGFDTTTPAVISEFLRLV